MALEVKMFIAAGTVASHPTADVTVPADFKLVGGGALIDLVDPGNYLTACFPIGERTWVAFGKDHEAPSPAAITVFAFALHDPNDEWEVHTEIAKGGPASAPRAVATLPPGFILTGGGAFVIPSGGAGNMLTASFPNADGGWEVRSKDHDTPDPCQIMAFAIGVRFKADPNRVRGLIVNRTSPSDPHPLVKMCLPDGFTLTGGGAFDQWEGGAGNLLTASCPDFPGLPTSSLQCWNARGKDHFTPSPAALEVFALGLQEG